MRESLPELQSVRHGHRGKNHDAHAARGGTFGRRIAPVGRSETFVLSDGRKLSVELDSSALSAARLAHIATTMLRDADPTVDHRLIGPDGQDVKPDVIGVDDVRVDLDGAVRDRSRAFIVDAANRYDGTRPKGWDTIGHDGCVPETFTTVRDGRTTVETVMMPAGAMFPEGVAYRNSTQESVSDMEGHDDTADDVAEAIETDTGRFSRAARTARQPAPRVRIVQRRRKGETEVTEWSRREGYEWHVTRLPFAHGERVAIGHVWSDRVKPRVAKRSERAALAERERESNTVEHVGAPNVTAVDAMARLDHAPTVYVRTKRGTIRVSAPRDAKGKYNVTATVEGIPPRARTSTREATRVKLAELLAAI